MTEPLRIALVSPEFPPEIGGMQTYAAEVAAELARRGHRVTVLTRRRATPPPRIEGVTVLQVLVGRAGADLRELRRVEADAWQVLNAAYAWVALHFAPTVVCVHGNDFLRPYIPVGEPDLSRWPGFWRSQRWRPALEAWIGRWRTPRLVRRGLERAAHVVANSRYTERVFLECFPACRGRTTAGMVGVGAAFLAPAAPRPPSDVTRFVTVCRLSEERKNVGLVLRALARLKERHAFRYAIVGDGDERPALERLARELGLADRVRFTGFLSAEAMRAELAAGDLFVLTAAIHPGSHEGFGIVYLEANACGTPTLAARLAGAAEAVQEGVSGYFVETLDVEGVSAALRRFLEGELRFAPEACRDFARRFTWTQVVDAALPWLGGARAAAPSPAAVEA